MMRFIRFLLRKMRLAARWTVKILFAPSHFNVPVYKRVWYAVFGGYMADQIVLYDFAHNDKKQYLSEFDWIRSRGINKPYNSLLDNKVIFEELIKNYCSTPPLIAVKKGDRITAMGGAKIKCIEDIPELLRTEGAFVVKPVRGGKGNGVRVAKYEDGVISVNGEPCNELQLIEMLSGKKDWCICRYAHQADYLNEIYPDSANTLRMIVLRDTPEQEFELAFSVQRIGAGWTGLVDNGSKGGLVANVNIATGELSHARTLHNLEVYNVHPDTGKPIKGVVIPHWEEIKASVLEVSSHFPFLDIIAWDILPTPDGFTVIEGNTSSGVNIIQLWGPQRYGRLGRFYREHGIIK